MTKKQSTIPDHTAVRVALWRAFHVQYDPPPHVLEDEVGLKLIAPDADWKNRPDMHPIGTRGYRASIVGRARLIEDLLNEKIKQGVEQYVILGAGLDTFAQRRPDLANKVQVFEVDHPDTQNWKHDRLIKLGYGIAKNLHLVPTNFEAGDSWREKLTTHGFDAKKPALISSTGVSMYLTLEANKETLKEMARFPKGSTFAMTFMLPLELIPPEERPGHLMVYERAKAAGTPFLSFFKPEEILIFAREAGFNQVRHVSGSEISDRYFSGRSDGLRPSTGEEFLIATT